MSQEKVDSGTIVLDKNGSEIGIIKKIYTNDLARLELPNSESVPLDLSLLTNIESSGRIIKKKSATIKPKFDEFLSGAQELLYNIILNGITILIQHISTMEIKKALQNFEFDFLNKVDQEGLSFHKNLGYTRGIELAGKTPQDFIVKMIFQLTEEKPELAEITAPEIFVDKLNQEKAFYRLLWNFSRFSITQSVKTKNIDLMYANVDAIFEIALKNIEMEHKNAISTDDILFWSNRIEDCLLKYIAVMINTIENDKKETFWEANKNKMLEELKKLKLNSLIKEQAQKAIEEFDYRKYENTKTLELMHAGIKGFNLKVMNEKNAMKELQKKINSHFVEGKTANISTIQKEVDGFNREIRDVSKDFLDILFEISKFLKKIEYGDSKIQDSYTDIMSKIQNRRYYELAEILDKLNTSFVKK